MSDVNTKVLRMVERELGANPSSDTTVLYNKAVKLDESIKELSYRQFFARYVLKFKRTNGKVGAPAVPGSARNGRQPIRSAEVGTPAASAVNANVNREGIRLVLVDLIRVVADSESRVSLVDTVVGVDRWVDRIVRITQPK